MQPDRRAAERSRCRPVPRSHTPCKRERIGEPDDRLAASQVVSCSSVRLRVYMFQSIVRRVARPRPPQSLLFMTFVVATCAVLSSSLSAQAPTTVTTGAATLRGAITTQNGAVFLPGVVVTVTEPASGATVAEATSDEAGKYRVPDLQPGTYTVRAFLDGFAEALKHS